MSMARSSSGLLVIIGATGIAGFASYGTLLVLPRVVGGETYALFAVFWSAMYLLVGSLGGIQQEIARATRPTGYQTTAKLSEAVTGASATGSAGTRARTRKFGGVAAMVVVGGVLVSAIVWQGSIFPQSGWLLVLPLSVGAGSYVVVACVCGSLYGVGAWRPAALLLAADALLRLVSVLGTALLTSDIVALSWAAALPFLATITLFGSTVMRTLQRGGYLDSGYRQIIWNVVRTVAASTSSALLISGYPLLLSIAAKGAELDLLSSLYLAITLTRAPLIVSVLSLQSFLVIRFRDHRSQVRRTLVVILGAIIAIGAAIGIMGNVLGPTVFAVLFPDLPALPGRFFAALVASSALVAALGVTGPAMLARANHALYSFGWAVAAGATILALFAPIGLLDRVLFSLIAGPVAGLVVHLLGAVILQRRDNARTAG